MKEETVGKNGRVTLLKIDDESTPYLFELKIGRETFTATPRCADGEGEIEGNELTEGELGFVAAKTREIEQEEI